MRFLMNFNRFVKGNSGSRWYSSSGNSDFSDGNVGKKSGFFLKLKNTLKLAVSVWVGYTTYEVIKFRTELPYEAHAQDANKPNVVLLGSGWGAASLLKELDCRKYNVTVVSPRNYFLFTPLLPSTTVGTVETRSIIEPIRRFLRRVDAPVRYLELECVDIDPIAKTVTCKDTTEIKSDSSTATIKYDYLVVAVGAENNTFGIEGVKENANFLKEVQDARNIRARIMDCFETASASKDEKEIKRLLHFVCVGAGPTGVEYAGELHDFIHNDLRVWFPDVRDKVSITVVESSHHLLSMYSKKVQEYCEETFKNHNIQVLTDHKVTKVTPTAIHVLDKSVKTTTTPTEKKEGKEEEEEKEIVMEYGLLLWATGNCARPLTSSLRSKLPSKDQPVQRGLVVDERLKVKGSNGIYAIGDCTVTPYPATAQVASQMGKYLGSVFNQMAKARESTSESHDSVDIPDIFRYSHVASLAYVGGERAVADLEGNVYAGQATNFLWRSAYLSMLFSPRNRFLVGLDWFKTLLFGRDISRS